MLEMTIVSISAVVGLLNQLVKYISMTYFKYDINKYIPLFSLGFGVILGIACYFTPSLRENHSITEAILIGLSAGAASTGVHQVGKQLSHENEQQVCDNPNNDDEPEE